MLLPMPQNQINLISLFELISITVYFEDLNILRSSNSLISVILDKFQANLPFETVFQCVLVLDSSAISSEIQNTINKLAEYGGITTSELYQKNFFTMFEKLTKNYKNWNSESFEPFLFAKLACRAGLASEEIIKIACFHCKNESDDKIKSLMLDVVLVCGKDSVYSQLLITDIIIPTSA